MFINIMDWKTETANVKKEDIAHDYVISENHVYFAQYHGYIVIDSNVSDREEDKVVEINRTRERKRREGTHTMNIISQMRRRSREESYYRELPQGIVQ